MWDLVRCFVISFYVSNNHSVLWPSAIALSDYIILHSSEMMIRNGSRILELGAGCGLTGLVCAISQPSCHVVVTDFNRTVLRNLERNVRLNELENVQVIGLDFAHLETTEIGLFLDMDGNPHEPVDLILGADVICQASDAHNVATTIDRLLKHRGQAWLVSATADHRFGVDVLASACGDICGLHVEVNDIETDSVGSLLEKTSGYVPGMRLQMFQITKIVHP